MAALDILTWFGSMHSCISYPNRGSHSGVKSSLNQRIIFGVMVVSSLLTGRRLERSSLEKLTWYSLMIVVMTLYRCKPPTQYYLSRLDLIQEQSRELSSEILPFFLVTIELLLFLPNFSW
jgi:hypothetical protein